MGVDSGIKSFLLIGFASNFETLKEIS